MYIPYSDILWTLNHWHFMFYFLLFSWRFFINYTRLFLILHCVYVFFGLLFPQEECICMKETENWENRSTKQFPILKTVWGIIRIVGDPICNIITNNDYLKQPLCISLMFVLLKLICKTSYPENCRHSYPYNEGTLFGSSPFANQPFLSFRLPYFFVEKPG